MPRSPVTKDGNGGDPEAGREVTHGEPAGPPVFDHSGQKPLSVRTLLGIPTLAVFPQSPSAPSPRPAAPVERQRPRAEVIVTPHDFPAKPDPRLVMLQDEASVAQAAAFRSLRHRLSERGNPKRVLVTSAVPKEGKTLAAVNLALALAESGRYQVLLVETNAARPTLADMFGLQRDAYACFLEQLEHHRSALEAPWKVAAVGPRALHLLPIAAATAGDEGQVARRRFLDAPLFSEAMARLKQSYDYIIVDGPSVLTGPDVNLLEDAVDGVVMVAQAGKSRGRKLRAALDQVTPGSVVGMVLLEN